MKMEIFPEIGAQKNFGPPKFGARSPPMLNNIFHQFQLHFSISHHFSFHLNNILFDPDSF